MTKTEIRRRRRPGDFSRVTIAILFVLLSAVAAMPVLTHPLPPLSDYVNHLARMHVITAIGSDPLLAKYYEVDWSHFCTTSWMSILPARFF
jgi:hypothetical protein